MLSVVGLSMYVLQGYGQATFNTHDSVDINNITARILVHGDMFWDPLGEVASTQYPAHSGKSVNFTSALWMSGYDAGGALHVAGKLKADDWNGRNGVQLEIEDAADPRMRPSSQA